MSKHTPGPWDRTTRTNIEGSSMTVIDANADGRIIAFVYEGDEANARLIAAAPEMLDALKQIEIVLNDSNAERRMERLRSHLRGVVLPAIAKAEGRK